MAIVAAAEAAALAIGRLDAALDGHPLRKAWDYRTRLAAAVQAAAWNGQAVIPSRLAGILAGVAYLPLDDYMAEHKALVFFDFLASLSDGERLVDAAEDDTGWRDLTDDLAVFTAAIDANKSGAILLALAEVAWQTRRQPGGRPGILHAAVPVTLARCGATRAGIVLGLAAYPPLVSRPVWVERFLEGLTRAAEDGLGRLRGLAVTAQDWQQRLGPRQKNSRLPQLVAAALCHPRLTPVGVRALFGSRTVTEPSGERRQTAAMSLPGAGKLLAEMVGLGILTEGTERRGSHRLYLAADLMVGKADARAPAPHPQEMARTIGGQHLDDLLDGIEASMRRSAALLARHGIAAFGGT